ncbi:flavin reductase family protein [Streptomyces sp. ITFR-6]|uniref:flavin reductase family protein n=1 Tax=Streptomyces sp. ITFR-6 TaxID=3075197 RepID=UPI00288A6B89|nr:flavin reductase family protein [Streptomyces sp. ITFR-6]WNI33259.1 flavin reductase family protein [Streptomyces sp. ITFR-6]
MSATAQPRRSEAGHTLAADFKDAMAALCSPVTVVTALREDGSPCGVTVSAFASLSLDPPMVTVALDRRSSLLPAVNATGRLGVCLLGAEDHQLALTFATSGADRFAAVPWHHENGLPRLSEAPVWLECEATTLVEGGDHVLVLAAGSREAPPLAYQNRRFGTHRALPAPDERIEPATTSTARRGTLRGAHTRRDTAHT